MKKTIVIGLVIGLIFASLGSTAAVAKKKKKKAAPVATKLFLHGTETIGEIEMPTNLLDGLFMSMDTTAGSSEKSLAYVNYVAGPNTQCAGNSLFPVWTGKIAGQVTGDIKVTFNSISSPGKVDIRVWPDVLAQACNESYPEPAGHVTVDLPPGSGTVEAVIPGVNFNATAALMVQITPVLPTEGGTPILGRVFYDTEGSFVEFSCIPAAGASCTG